MKKTLIICSAIVLSAIIFSGVYFSVSSPTVDFRGEIIHIENTDDDIIYTVKGIEPTQYTVLADEHTNIRYCHIEDGDIYIGDIKIGDTIQGTYKKWFSEDNYAKTIEVEKH